MRRNPTIQAVPVSQYFSHFSGLQKIKNDKSDTCPEKNKSFVNSEELPGTKQSRNGSTKTICPSGAASGIKKIRIVRAMKMAVKP